MTTLNFHLEIGPGTGHSYSIGARAPDGEATATMHLPVPLTELDHQLGAIRDAVLASATVPRGTPDAGEEPVRQLGQWLFEALITDDVRSLYTASSSRARAQGSGLRLVLRVRPPELARLPWEFLFDPLGQGYLGLSVPLVRYPEALVPRQPLRVATPLRILGMVAHPYAQNRNGQHTLKVDDEQRRLRAALVGLERDGVVELSWVAGQTYGDLANALNLGPWHAFHFIGHGGYDRDINEGALALADNAGRTQLIRAADLSRLLTAHHTLRLVVLSSCNTGVGDTTACDIGRSSTSEAFSSMAGTLVRSWIPAVVAMQCDITDQGTIVFSQTFYRNVAKGLPADTSVGQARQALRLVKKDTLEWGVPRLYLRAPDEHIFDITMKSPAHPGHSPQEENTPEEENPLEEENPPETAALYDPPSPPIDFPQVTLHPRLAQTMRHDKAVNAVTFSPDGHRLATASHDETARIWNVTSGREHLSVRHKGTRSNVRGRGVNVRGRAVQGVAFSPDGQRLATASDDYTVRIWDATSGKKLTTATHNNVVQAVTFSPDGHWLATACDDHTAQIWHATSGKRFATLPHDNQVYAVAFSPDGHRLATVSSDRTARIWDATSGAHLTTFTHDKAALGVAFSPDGRWLATAGDDSTARIWDATSGAHLTTLTHDNRVWAVTFSPDSSWLASAGDDSTARIWDATSGRQLATLTHDNPVYGVAFSPDGHRLATASRDKTVRIWSLLHNSGDE